MSNDINVTDGIILEALNSKIDLDGSNYKGSELETYIHEHCGADKAAEKLTEKLTECIAVVETYHNGTSWYRIYSDGWCEQGGYITANGTVSFLKPFIDTNYTLVFGSTGDTNGIPRAVRASRTTSSFAYGSANQANAPADWQASGYIT